jgi:subtilisin-like proprotein convertase family protein
MEVSDVGESDVPFSGGGVEVKRRVGSAAVAAVVLFLGSASAWAEATNLVYTFGANFNLKIPADPAATRGWMQNAVICVPSHMLICDLDVLVDIRHPSAVDLQLSLQGPGGQSIMLSVGDPYEQYSEGQDYDSTVFDDEATVRIQDAMAPFSGSFQPLHALAAFDGQDAYGIWQLQVLDMCYGHRGILDSFILRIAVLPPAETLPVPAPAACGLAVLGMALTATGRRLTCPLATRRPSRGPSAPESS